MVVTNVGKGSMRISVLKRTTLSSQDVDDWDALYQLQSAPSNPFLSPTWVLCWYEHYSEPEDQHVILVRDDGSNDLIGVAPMHRQLLRFGPVKFAHRLVSVGIGIGPNPYEVPGFLAHPERSRDVARAIVKETLGATSDWCELAINPTQGWFEPEWTYGIDRPATFSCHQRPRACVILPLPDTWAELRSSLKRNIKESLRRSNNRLIKSGRQFSLHRRIGLEVTTEIVGRLLDLHRLRSENDQASVHHPDAFADARSRSLLMSVIPQLAREGRASIIELKIDGKVLASQLVLLSPGSTYIHSSGFHADIWSLGPVTYLHAEAVKGAIERGDSVVNFSPGPNVSKLRWSEQLWVSNEFAYGSGPRAVGIKFGTHQAMSAVRASRAAITFVKKSAAVKPGKAELRSPRDRGTSVELNGDVQVHSAGAPGDNFGLAPKSRSSAGEPASHGRSDGLTAMNNESEAAAMQ